MSEKPAADSVTEARRLRDAIERLLTAPPNRARAARLTVTALAREADVARTALYRHPDLFREFMLRRELTPDSPAGPAEEGLRALLGEAKEKITLLQKELEEQQELAQGLAQQVIWLWASLREANRRTEERASDNPL